VLLLRLLLMRPGAAAAMVWRAVLIPGRRGVFGAEDSGRGAGSCGTATPAAEA